MSLADCPKCWDSPCTCGNDYKCWDEEMIEEQIRMLERVLEEIRQKKNKI